MSATGPQLRFCPESNDLLYPQVSHARAGFTIAEPHSLERGSEVF